MTGANTEPTDAKHMIDVLNILLLLHISSIFNIKTSTPDATEPNTKVVYPNLAPKKAHTKIPN